MPKRKRRENNNRNNVDKKIPLHERNQIEVKELERRIQDEAPDRGFMPNPRDVVAFRSLPISQATLMGLESAKYTTMTAIQNACIPHALAGRDILGAARTGSGKSLAFLVPLLETLFKSDFGHEDGTGAIVLSPTRELADQLFQVLRAVGSYHSFRAGLVVGGRREFQMEQANLARTNILVATPGRILQHLEQTPQFEYSNLKVLVLDEADRILDMGFRPQMMRILDYLPTTGRQTMLFSATQTRKVSDLAALSLSRPEYLGVHDKEQTETPDLLQQFYVVVPLEHKLNCIYSFLKSHLRAKIIIFVASCSQVRHAWELFCALQPGLPVMALHGKLSQERRTNIFRDFMQKRAAVLFATDVAARGLDFPHVDWVVQMDAPESREMYIHRVGRTARYKASGNSLLVLAPSEQEGFVKLLLNQQDGKELPVKKIQINPSKTMQVNKKAAALVTQRQTLHALAKKAFRSYTRCIHLMPNKDIFKLDELPLDDYATSLGLSSTPKLKHLNQDLDRNQLRVKKNVNHKLHRLKEQIKAEKLQRKLARQGKTMEEYEESKKQKAKKKDQDDEEEQEDDDEMLVVKRKLDVEKSDDLIKNNDAGSSLHQVSQPRKKLKIRIDGTDDTKHTRFDEAGDVEATMLQTLSARDMTTDDDNIETQHEEYLAKVKARLATNADVDRREEKDRIREKHRKQKFRDKEKQEKDDGEQVVAVLDMPEEEEDVGSNIDGESESDDDDSEDDEDDDDSSVDDDSDSSSSTTHRPTETDVNLQEEAVLAMIRGNT